MWMMPMYLHVNQKSDYDMMMMMLLYPQHMIDKGVYSFCLLCNNVCLYVCVCVNFFMSKISQELLHLGF